jgi:adenosylhomocysteine nucleosidase
MKARDVPALVVCLLAWSSPASAQSVVGVLGIADEVAAFEQQVQNGRDVAVSGYVFRVGTLDGREVVVGRSGAGKVNAAIVTTLLIDHFRPAALFFSGTAGAVDLGLRQGDVVVGGAVAQHDAGALTAAGIVRRGLRNPVSRQLDPLLVPAPAQLLDVARRSILGLTLPSIEAADGTRVPRITEGVIVTGDVFVIDAVRREELRSVLGAAVVEMEGGAMVQTCRQFAVPCLVVRSVTDRADAEASADYKQFIAIASRNAAAVVAAIIRRLDVR